MFEKIGPKFEDRNGGYTRLIKLGFRGNDCAPISIIELVDFQDGVDVKSTKAKKLDILFILTYSLVIFRLKRATFFVALIFLFTGNIYSKEPLLKALWVVRDDMISKDLIDKFISYSVLNGYKHIFVQVRGERRCIL